MSTYKNSILWLIPHKPLETTLNPLNLQTTLTLKYPTFKPPSSSNTQLSNHSHLQTTEELTTSSGKQPLKECTRPKRSSLSCALMVTVMSRQLLCLHHHHYPKHRLHSTIIICTIVFITILILSLSSTFSSFYQHLHHYYHQSSVFQIPSFSLLVSKPPFQLFHLFY